MSKFSIGDVVLFKPLDSLEPKRKRYVIVSPCKETEFWRCRVVNGDTTANFNELNLVKTGESS